MQPPQIPADVLIVDDNPTNLQLLSRILQDHGYRVRAVTSGARALASVQMLPPELILLDIRMPGLDGYEVCRRLKADPATEDIPVLFISALDEVSDKLQAFEAGGVDYITKPFQLAEVIARIETHLSLRRLQAHLQETNRRMEYELELAARVQFSFLPARLPALPGWQLSASLLPVKVVSGDFFDVVPLPLAGNAVALVIADVADKGVGAALFMAMTCALLRAYLLWQPPTDDSAGNPAPPGSIAAPYAAYEDGSGHPERVDHPARPGEVLRAVNRRLVEYTSGGQFVTLFLGILEPESGVLTYASAGHDPPLWVCHSPEGGAHLLRNSGPPLGVVEDGGWANMRIQLSSEDALILYTDGITEAENERDGFFGPERLVELVCRAPRNSAEQLRDTIVETVHDFTAGVPPRDDIAVMVVLRE